MNPHRGWRLRPVIELEPAAFGTFEPPWPREQETVEQRALYWRTCLERSGIAGLQPVAPASWNVPASEIRDIAMLATILRVHFGDDGVPSSPEETLPLSGGLAVLHEGQVIVEPGCCADLSDLEGWAAAARHESDAPEMLWIGHPSLFLRREGDVLCFHEEAEGTAPDPAVSFRIAPAVLAAAVDEARAELDPVVERVLAALGTLGAASPALAARMVGR